MNKLNNSSSKNISDGVTQSGPVTSNAPIVTGPQSGPVTSNAPIVTGRLPVTPSLGKLEKLKITRLME